MQTLASLLTEKRHYKKLTDSDVSKALKVPIAHIRSIERNSFDIFQTELHAVSAVKAYAQLVGLPPDRAVAYLRKDWDNSPVRTNTRKKSSIKTNSLVTASVGVLYSAKWWAIILAVLLGIFGFYEMGIFFSTPNISKISVTVGEKDGKKTLVISGYVAGDTGVKVNAERATVKPTGQFIHELVDLPKNGMIVVEAMGANGRISKVERPILKL